jgi:succinoglycan biosynthesis transport protein ExoP
VIQEKIERDRAEMDPRIGAPVPFAYWLDIRGLVRALYRQKWLIAAIVALGLGAAAAYLFLATPQYTATTELLIDTRGLTILDTDQVSPTISSEVGAIESQVEILRSTQIARNVLSQVTGSAPTEKDLQSFMRRLKVERRGLSYVVDVSYTDQSASTAAEIANKIAAAYVAEQLDVKVQAAREANEWLKSRVEKSSKALYTAEMKLQNFRAEQERDEPAGSESAETDTASNVEGLAAAQEDITEAEAELKSLDTTLQAALSSGAADDAAIPAQLAELRQRKISAAEKVEAIRRVRAEDDKFVQQAKADLDAANAALQAAVKELKDGAAANLQDAKSRLARLEAGPIRETAPDPAMAALKLAELEREAEAVRELHATLIKRFLETEAQETLQTADARVISAAVSPDTASSPKKRLVLALGFLGSLMLGLCLALIVDNWRRLWAAS